MDYLKTLNSEQKNAAMAIFGPVLIVAGAGAGKTKTITHRILHIIASGIKPENILAITFTNKAAKEMKERVFELIKQNSELLGTAKKLPFVSTFHSLGVQIIKENSELLKIPRHFNIFDKTDSKKVIKEAISSLGLEPKDHLDKISHIISYEKSRGISLNEYLERGFYDQNSELVKKVWSKYEETLKKEGALDFDDLLLKTLKLLKKYPDVLDKYQNRFLYVHVDEYQDTNRVQNNIIELLVEKHKNICVVGDTDQNIYSWRGAEIKNMLHFEKVFPEVKTFFLEQNYRSTKNILDVANKVIEKNNFRIPKKLFTLNEIGEKISIFEGRDETAEAYFIANKSKDLIENGVNPEEIAVLYRANFQSRILEEAFLANTVPYQMVGTKFFERKEIKDCLSYIRASLNEESLSDFARIINVPTRGIGKTTLQKILQGKEDELPVSMKIKIINFRKMLSDFKEVLLKEPPSVAIKYIIKNSGMEEYYKTGLEEDTERLENIMELVTMATSYDSYEKEIGIENFLTDSALASDQDSLDDKKSVVKLMTVHSSKGLEFQYVFICGLEANLFPHNRMNKDKKSGEDAEEERRLFYVAITRASKKLYLTHARVRTIFGSMEVNSPSEFLEDIPPEYTEIEYSDALKTSKSPLFSIDF